MLVTGTSQGFKLFPLRLGYNHLILNANVESVMKNIEKSQNSKEHMKYANPN
jgi:hypothetical protein